jgi:hypothetical protein
VIVGVDIDFIITIDLQPGSQIALRMANARAAEGGIFLLGFYFYFSIQIRRFGQI